MAKRESTRLSLREIFSSGRDCYTSAIWESSLGFWRIIRKYTSRNGTSMPLGELPSGSQDSSFQGMRYHRAEGYLRRFRPFWNIPPRTPRKRNSAPSARGMIALKSKNLVGNCETVGNSLARAVP